MQIKEVAARALRFLGREDVAGKVASGEIPENDAELVRTLVFCINAVEDELARYYFPLVRTQTMISYNGKYYFRDFDSPPVKILSVVSGEKETAYEIFPTYIATEATRIEVTYEYAPVKKELDDDCEYSAEVDETLEACGAAAEYCLIKGEIEAADMWESKYRAQIDRARRKSARGANIPPRRWV